MLMELHVQNLCKTYDGKEVLRNVTFSATSERIICVMAPSGTGKTTLLRILLGLEQPDSGTIDIPQNFRWSAVFQENRLLESLDAMENLRFVLGNQFDPQEATALLRELGLDDIEGKPVRSYSGGMKRRLALARALLAPADGLILDEPFAGLDEVARGWCIRCILRKAVGRIVFLVTHDPADVDSLNADNIRLEPFGFV